MWETETENWTEERPAFYFNKLPIASLLSSWSWVKLFTLLSRKENDVVCFQTLKKIQKSQPNHKYLKTFYADRNCCVGGLVLQRDMEICGEAGRRSLHKIVIDKSCWWSIGGSQNPSLRALIWAQCVISPPLSPRLWRFFPQGGSVCIVIAYQTLLTHHYETLMWRGTHLGETETETGTETETETETEVHI